MGDGANMQSTGKKKFWSGSGGPERPRAAPAPPPHESTVDMLNRLYYGFKEDDNVSPLGVTISMASEFAVYCNTGCHTGFADCRLSAALYNQHMLLNEEGHVALAMDRISGFVINQQLVEQRLGKCSYMWDGATFVRYNNACGCGAGSMSCEEGHSAFANQCRGHTCSVTDPEVSRCSCERLQIPDQSDHVQCYFKGPAFDVNNVSPTTDQLRWMVKERLSRQQGEDTHGSKLKFWNEVVLDERVLLEELKRDAANVVPAFVYPAGNRVGRRIATRMRDDFVAKYKAKKEIPVVAVLTKQDVAATDRIFIMEADSVVV